MLQKQLYTAHTVAIGGQKLKEMPLYGHVWGQDAAAGCRGGRFHDVEAPQGSRVKTSVQAEL